MSHSGLIPASKRPEFHRPSFNFSVLNSASGNNLSHVWQGSSGQPGIAAAAAGRLGDTYMYVLYVIQHGHVRRTAGRNLMNYDLCNTYTVRTTQYSRIIVQGIQAAGAGLGLCT